MMTKPRARPAASSAGQRRQRDLQLMLLDRQRDMQAMLQRRVRHVPANGSNDGLDESEHAEAEVQDSIEIALIQMKGEALQHVREALVRLDAGAYGFCVECKGEMSEPRLRALPFAVRCTACEGAHEERVAVERRSVAPQGFRSVFADHAGR